MSNTWIEEFNLVDVWRRLHPNDSMYTRLQKNPIGCSRLDYILISSDLLNNVKETDINGIDSDHNMVKLKSREPEYTANEPVIKT